MKQHTLLQEWSDFRQRPDSANARGNSWVGLPRLPLALHQASRQDRAGTVWPPYRRDPQAPRVPRRAPRAPRPAPRPKPAALSARGWNLEPRSAKPRACPRPELAVPTADRPGYLKRVLGVVHVAVHALVDHALGLLLPAGAQHPPQAALHWAHLGRHLLQLLRAGPWGGRARWAGAGLTPSASAAENSPAWGGDNFCKFSGLGSLCTAGRRRGAGGGQGCGPRVPRDRRHRRTAPTACPLPRPKPGTPAKVSAQGASSWWTPAPPCPTTVGRGGSGRQREDLGLIGKMFSF